MTRGDGHRSLHRNDAVRNREQGFLVKLASLIATVVMLSCGVFVSAQDGTQGHGGPTPLTDAVAEAKNNNTQIAAEDHGWRASAYLAQQISGIPDSQLAALSPGMGDPKPSELSGGGQVSMGMKPSEKLPYPAELRLRGEAARREAETQRAQIDVLRSDIVDQVKTIYLRLAYLYQMYDLDDRGAADLAALIQNEVSKYSLGMGTQAEVLQAQLERSKLLRETTLQHEEVGGLQSDLKALLHRLPDSPDVIPETVSLTPFKRAASDLATVAENRNPLLIVDSKMTDAQEAQLNAAKSDTNPDFTLGYTFSPAGESHRHGYVLSFNVQLPRDQRVDAEMAAARERLESSRAQASEDRLRKLAEVQKQYVIVKSSEEQIRECKEALVPQSRALYQSKLAGYQSDREKFSAVIQAFLDEITFENNYLQALLDHETALVHLETLTGEKLR